METAVTNSKNGPTREIWLFSFMAVIWVALLCVPPAMSQALWNDDLYSLRAASLPSWELIRLSWEYHHANFDHPPLYFLILKPVVAISSSHFFVRLPSLFFLALSSIVLALDLRSRGASRAAAIALGFLIVLHPLTRHSGISVRMYTQFLLLIVSLLWVMWRAADSSEGWFTRESWLAGILMALMCYTSYFGYVMGLGIAMLVLTWLAFPRLGASAVGRKAGGRLLLGGILAMLLLSPWIPALGHLATSEQAPREEIYAMARKDQLIEMVHEFGGGWVGVAWMLSGWTALMCFGVRRARWLSMVIFIVIIPCVFMGIFTPESRLIQARYLLFAVVVLLTGTVMGWESVARRWGGRPRNQIIIVLSLAILPATFMAQTSRTGKLKVVPDWWEAAAILETQAESDDLILTGGFLSGELIEYHMKHPDHHHFIHHVVRLDPFYAACRNPKVAWFVTGSPTPKGYQDILDRYFPYRVEFEGNQGLSPIQVMAKRPFRLTSGKKANYQEPIALDYEQPGYRQPEPN